jgi:hypothetical protein
VEGTQARSRVGTLPDRGGGGQYGLAVDPMPTYGNCRSESNCASSW